MIDPHKFIPARHAPSICDGCAYPEAHEIHAIGPPHIMDSAAHPTAAAAAIATEPLAPIIRLCTPTVRSELEREAYRDAAHAEALAMLRRMGAIIESEREAGRRCTGVVIAVVFEDGSYGRLLPDGAENAGTLLGAIESAKLEFVATIR